MKDLLRRIDELLAHMQRKRPWLAQRTGIKLGTINTWFNRDTYPRADEAFRIADELNTTVEYLMTGEETHRPEQDINPVLSELCEYLSNMGELELLQFKGWAMAFRHVTLLPQTGSGTPRKEEAAQSQTNGG